MDKFNPEEKKRFLLDLFEKLMPGSRPGFLVCAASKNKYDLAAITGERTGYLVYIRDDNPAIRWHSNRDVPVKELAVVTGELYPKFLVAPQFITPERLEADYAVGATQSYCYAFDALRRRINKHHMVMLCRDPKDWRKIIAQMPLGRSIQEAVLRAAL